MRDRVFLDTNVVVYLYSNSEPAKRALVGGVVERHDPVVSTQVLSELANVLLRKLALPVEAVDRLVDLVAGVETLGDAALLPRATVLG